MGLGVLWDPPSPSSPAGPRSRIAIPLRGGDPGRAAKGPHRDAAGVGDPTGTQGDMGGLWDMGMGGTGIPHRPFPAAYLCLLPSSWIRPPAPHRRGSRGATLRSCSPPACGGVPPRGSRLQRWGQQPSSTPAGSASEPWLGKGGGCSTPSVPPSVRPAGPLLWNKAVCETRVPVCAVPRGTLGPTERDAPG